MTEYKCGYEGLCNMQHPITDVHSANRFGKGCLLNSCIKETNYYLPIPERSDEKSASYYLPIPERSDEKSASYSLPIPERSDEKSASLEKNVKSE